MVVMKEVMMVMMMDVVVLVVMMVVETPSVACGSRPGLWVCEVPVCLLAA